jgi:hypothetical protein
MAVFFSVFTSFLVISVGFSRSLASAASEDLLANGIDAITNSKFSYSTSQINDSSNLISSLKQNKSKSTDPNEKSIAFGFNFLLDLSGHGQNGCVEEPDWVRRDH